ncbi:hypothetical protein FPRO04_14671 [Fusarium proliferatum]|nr:hypothetical protein FPRO04_14671 [Fusarium proliferatum]
MASSSQQPTDCTSQSQMSIDPTVDAESPSSDVLNFDCIFRATYPNKGQFGPSGKRRTKGTVVYECLLCSSDQAWSSPKRDNAIYHAKRKHGDIVNSSDNTILERSSDMGPPLKQARLDNYYTATPSESALRKVFNSQRYTESMVGLLTRRRLPFSAVTHSGEHQSLLIFSTLDLYDIANQLGCHTGDNATSNDTCLQHLSAKLKQDHNINWDPKRHRIRCILHVINLSLQAFLFASSREALQAALDAASDITGDELYELFNSILNDASGDDTPNQPDQMGAQTRHPGGVASKKASIQKENPPSRSGNRSDSTTRRKGWILMPALRKLHRIGLWLRNSSIHSDAWDERIKLRLGIDNDTRWNSWYRMIDNLIRKKQQELYEAEETRDPLMLHSIDMGWFVLDKYYALSGESPIYATALLLDPSKRARYLKVHWKEEWAATAIRDGRTIWEEEYKMAPALGPAQALSEASRSQQGQPNELDRLLNEIMVAEDITRDVDDFENFIHAQPIKIEGSPLVWWCQRDQVRTYPRLSRMAIDILSVPPGSADPESAFSGGRRTLSWDRERMSCVNLEKVECIGNWLREGLIIPSSRGGRGLVVDGEINGSIWVDSDDYLD